MAQEIFATGDWDEYESELNAFLSYGGITIGVGVPDAPHGGKRASASGLTLQDIVEMNEFGSGNIPPRPVFGPTMDDHGRAYVDSVARSVKQMMKRSGSRSQLASDLEGVGEQMKKDVQRRIEANEKPNAKATADRKGHAFSWQETGEVFESIEGVVQIDAKFESVGAQGHRYRGDRGQFTKIGR